MSEVTNPEPKRTLTDEEVGAAIVEMMDGVASMHPDMIVSKHLIAVIAAHANADGKLDVPVGVLQLEVARSIGVLEARIFAIEKGLEKAGIEMPDILPEARKML